MNRIKNDKRNQMKKIIYYLSVLVIVLTAIISCKRMDSTYEQYIVPGGKTYIGKAKVAVHSGRNRIILSWPKGSDPNVSLARVFWNNFADSAEVQIKDNVDTVKFTIENLEEKIYSFTILTYDKSGNKSIPVEVLSAVYGENYESGILNRAIRSAEVDAGGKMVIMWGAADVSSGAFQTEITYINNTGHTKTQNIKAKDSVSTLSDYKSGTIPSFRTKFLPDSLAIDTFYTNSQNMRVSRKFVKSGWTASTDSYEKTGQLPNGAPEKVLDDNVNTFWHTNHSVAPAPGYPHWLAFDMKTSLNITRIELTSRSNFFKEDFTEFTVQGSLDGITWANYGAFKLAEVAAVQSFNLTGVNNIRYLRLYMTKGTTIYAHLAEFSAFGY